MKLPYHTKADAGWDSEDDTDDVLVIGIDFGTTYSGVAWATKADFESNQINLITNWPDYGREEGKAPTELFYEDGQIQWGYDIPSDGDPVRWFKLLLLREEDVHPELRSSEFLLRARKMLRENDTTAINLIADYLRLLWQHVTETIIKARGEEVVDALTFQIVITVPAIWKGYARQAMEEAARKAGMLEDRAAGQTTLSFAPEPEAAAFSTLCDPARRPKEDDVYVICDAGGGTVDLISYKINSTNPLRMEEAVEGSGGLCGGIFIDEGFEHICKSRLGRKWDRLSKAGIKEVMRGEWEQAIKPHFKPGNANKEYIVSIPAEAFGKQSLDDTSREPVIKNGRIHFKEDHIQGAYTNVFAKIGDLVDAQIKKARDQGMNIAGIILVGGLGGSPYLHDHLKARYMNPKIVILQESGMKPRTAICRGAVFKGFLEGASAEYDSEGNITNIDAPIQVTSTIARASYGNAFRAEFDEDLHLEEDKEWDATEGIWRAGNQMQWYVTKGENVSKKEPVSESFYRIVDGNFDGFFTVDMLQCEDENTPPRVTSSVVPFCSIECKLDVPASSLENFTRVSDNKRMKKMSYVIKMVPSGASVEFGVYFQGRKLGTQNSKISFK